MVVERLRACLSRPIDGASVAAFRAVFGCLLLISTARFLRHGWVTEYFTEPKHFFHYWGFSWLEPLPGVGMTVLYGALLVCASGIALGFQQRFAAAAFTLGFGFAHFCDKANYLNHYYLVTLLSALCTLLPLDRVYSVRVWLRPEDRAQRTRAWVLYLLRVQIALVYVFGGIGKIGPDWLIHAQPLRLWLAANIELPVLGRFFLNPGLALAFSWCGALFDLSIVALLLYRQTRAPAYALVVVFHVLTALLFHIGMFPWIMIGCATIFFNASWPRPLLARWGVHPASQGGGEVIGAPPLRRSALFGLALYACCQLLLPLRSLCYPGNTLWTEEGFRFSWKVMLIEKSGALDLWAQDRAGRRFLVEPRQYLSPFQARMAATQPDMILELAHWVAADFERTGHGQVQVFADSEVSFNGRPHQRLIDPNVDLARQNDGLRAKHWILPAPSGPPP